MMNSEESNKLLLQALLESHPNILANAKAMMLSLEDKKRRTVNSTAKQYRTATVVYHCLHCESTFNVEKTLETKTESFSYVGHDKNIYIVRYRDIASPITVHATCRICEECKRFISSLSREELEQRYLNILNKDPITMTHPPVKPAAMKIEDEGEKEEDDGSL